MTIVEILRATLRRAILQTEETRTKFAYLQQPDSECEDDWHDAEEWKI